jgi:hypothetical protein
MAAESPRTIAEKINNMYSHIIPTAADFAMARDRIKGNF